MFANLVFFIVFLCFSVLLLTTELFCDIIFSRKKRRGDFSMNKILRLEPAYKDYVWGGEKLVKEYNKNSPYAKTAESWELSCHKNGLTRISGGDFDGKTLREAIETAKNNGVDILGKSCEKFSDFPVLIKLIDADASLSIQVHPDNEYANEHENGGFGKTEVWYVVSADEGAELVYGFKRDVTREELREAILKNELPPLLNSVPVKAGDVFFVPAGLLHAIGKGILICEIQQNSDTTYRVYDWGRVGADGKPRELHVERALDVLKLSGEELRDFSPELISAGDGYSDYMVARCEYFTATVRKQESASALATDGSSFKALTFVSGEGKLVCGEESADFKRGDIFFLPAAPAEYAVLGKCEFLITEV